MAQVEAETRKFRAGQTSEVIQMVKDEGERLVPTLLL